MHGTPALSTGSVTLPTGRFSDPNLPDNYAPFDVQVLGNKVYVTYAQQDAAKHDDVGGIGHGFIDVFNLDGTPGLPGGQERLVSHDHLDRYDLDHVTVACWQQSLRK